MTTWKPIRGYFNDCSRGDHQGCLGKFQHHNGWAVCHCPHHTAPSAPQPTDGRTEER